MKNRIITAAILFALACGVPGLLANTATDAGQTLYRKNCASCHGMAGKGDGPAAMALDPKPANFTDPALMHKATDQQLLGIIQNGFPKSDMKAWKGKLTEDQMKELVAYIRTFAPSTASR